MNRKKILVIDDEELVIQSIEKLLRMQGYQVIPARSGREALERVKESDFDLIITDIRMPESNGVDTLSKIREILKGKGSPKVPEICITGYADDEILKKAERLGVADYLYKPFDLKDFLARIESILRTREMEYFTRTEKAFVYKYVVMLTDTDQFKHMSFANYLRLMFLATDALLMPCLRSDLLSQARLKLVTSRMQFKKQSAPGEVIVVKVNASEVNTADFSLLYTFVMEGSAELVGLGRQTYEFISLETAQRAQLPEPIKQTLTPIKVEEDNLVYKY